jgi:proprotein convertase subtilisin/kexin type 5
VTDCTAITGKPAKYFYADPPTQSCKACETNTNQACSTCLNTADHCLTCTGVGGKSYLDDTVCVAACPDTSIPNEALSQFTCDPCDSTKKCKTCQTVKDTCTSCLNNYYLFGTACIADCGTGFTPVLQVCQACQLPCKTCSGTTQACITCTGTLG